MESVTRRTALRGAAWSVPVLAATAAVPLAAASGAVEQSDLLAVSVSGPLEPTSEIYRPANEPVWRTGQTYTFRAVVQNAGPAAAAPGARIRFDVQTYDALATQVFPASSLRSISPGFTPTNFQTSGQAIMFDLVEEFPAGAVIEVVFAAEAIRQEYAPRDPGQSYARLAVEVVWNAPQGSDPDFTNNQISSEYFYMANPGTSVG